MPDLTFSQARSMLADSTVDKGAPGLDDHYGHGNLDIFALLSSYPPRAMVALDPLAEIASDDLIPGPSTASGHQSSAPANSLPDSLVIRWHAGVTDRGLAGQRLQAQHSAHSVRGTGSHTLVTLAPGQDREALKLTLEADAALAAVFYKQPLPAMKRHAGTARRRRLSRHPDHLQATPA